MQFYDRAIELSKETRSDYDMAGQLYLKAKLLYGLSKMRESMSVNDEAYRAADKIHRHDIKNKCRFLKYKIEKDTGSLLNMINENNLENELSAEIYYELWKLAKNEKYRTMAMESYNKLVEKNNKFEYLRRIRELSEKEQAP